MVHRYESFGWLRGGLLTSNNPKWRHDRRLLGPCFSQAAVTSMGPIFYTHAQRLVTHLLDKAKEGVEVDMAALMAKMTLAIICHAGFGHVPEERGGEGEEGEDEVSQAVNVALKEIVQRFSDPLSLMRFMPARYRQAQAARRTLMAVSPLLCVNGEKGMGGG
jgi:cytochrome P450